MTVLLTSYYKKSTSLYFSILSILFSPLSISSHRNIDHLRRSWIHFSYFLTCKKTMMYEQIPFLSNIPGLFPTVQYKHSIRHVSSVKRLGCQPIQFLREICFLELCVMSSRKVVYTVLQFSPAISCIFL